MDKIRKKRIEKIVKKDVLLLKKYKKKKEESNFIKEIPDHEKSYQDYKDKEKQRIEQQRKEIMLR